MKRLWQWSQLIQRWWRRIYECSEDHWWFSYLILEPIALINNSINQLSQAENTFMQT